MATGGIPEGGIKPGIPESPVERHALLFKAGERFWNWSHGSREYFPKRWAGKTAGPANGAGLGFVNDV